MTCDLGVLFTAQGKLEEAEQTLRSALEGREQTFGVDHPIPSRLIIMSGISYESSGSWMKQRRCYGEPSEDLWLLLVRMT